MNAVRKRPGATPPFAVEVFKTGFATVVDSTGRTAWEARPGAVLLSSRAEAEEVLRILEAGN